MRVGVFFTLMDSLLESFRILHEERERLINEMVQELVYKKKNIHDEINSGHRFKMHLERYSNISKKLVEFYEDRDNLKRDESNMISGGNEFAEFYGRIRNSKDYFRKNPEYVDTLASEFIELKKAREKNQDDLVDFTDEEAYGKFLDLHSLYYQFLNIKPLEHYDRLHKLTYTDYLSFIYRLYDIPFEVKNHEDYPNYVESLQQYLFSYITRAKPLIDIESEEMDHFKQFESQWSCGDFPGWNVSLLNSIHHTRPTVRNVLQLIDLNNFETPQQLESVGLNELKNILQALGLKCGGTLSQRACRLFQLKHTSIDQLDKSLFVEKSKDPEYKSLEEYKKLAYIEAKIYLYFDILKNELESTKDNVERKQARTADEMLNEGDDAKIEETIISEDEDEFQDKTLYNPKNLPLDFDGKPIPYWLYKLHGLNVSYNCEICGNSKYRGPKAFQRHFGEWRHAHGMRCLGIPNTAHFVNVTKIQDAYHLWDVIKNNKQKEQWNPDNDEEYEDTDGNPINKKIYDDLRRQGLL